MPVFELYNPDGSLQFDMAGRVPRFLGGRVITAAGTLVDPGLLTGAMFYTVNMVEAGLTDGTPAVTVSGQTLRWTAPGRAMYLSYGVY